MRLIDADLLREKAKDYFISPDGALRLIENQPTAFDLENVIERINEADIKTIETYSEGYPMEEDFISVCDVIKILKSAANATNGKNGG